MKKAGIIVLIVILILIIISLIQVLLMSMNGEGNIFEYMISGKDARNENNIRKDEKIDISEIENLEFDFRDSNMNIILTDETELRVIQYSTKELEVKELFDTDRNDKTLIISEGKMKFRIVMGFWDNAYDIYIPKTYVENLKVKTASSEIYLEEDINLKKLEMDIISGDININSKVDIKELDIKTTSGDVQIEEICSEKIKIKTTSGNTRIGLIESNESEMNSISGDVKLGNVISKLNIDTKSGNIKIDAINGESKLETVSGDVILGKLESDLKGKTTSGKVVINSIEGKIELKTISGDVDIEEFNILKDSEVETTSGDVKIKLTDSSNCNINTKTISGDIKLPNGSSVFGKEPYNKLNIKTTSGDIKFN